MQKGFKMKNKVYLFLAIVAVLLNLKISTFAFYRYPSLLEISKIQFQIYDTKGDRLTSKVLNNYGNDMNIFLSIYLNQKKDVVGHYKIIVEGFGKGRQNEAEGKVDDYSVVQEKDVVLYYEGGRFIPFILDFPCTKEAIYKITVKKDGETILEAKEKSKFSFCYLN